MSRSDAGEDDEVAVFYDLKDPSKPIPMRARPACMRAPPGGGRKPRSTESGPGKTNKNKKAQKDSSSKGKKRLRGEADVDDLGRPIAPTAPRSRNSNGAAGPPGSRSLVNSYEQAPAADAPSRQGTESQGPADSAQQQPSKKKQKIAWTDKEEELLREGILRCGLSAYKEISKIVKTRSQAQCKLRLRSFYLRLVAQNCGIGGKSVVAAVPKARRQSQEADEALFQAFGDVNHDPAAAEILRTALLAQSASYPHQAFEPSLQAAALEPLPQSGEQHLQYNGFQLMSGHPQYGQNYEQSYGQEQQYHQTFMQMPSSLYLQNQQQQQQQQPPMSQMSLLEPLGHGAQEQPPAQFSSVLSSALGSVEDQHPHLPQGIDLPFMDFLGTPEDSGCTVDQLQQLLFPSDDTAAASAQERERHLGAGTHAGMHFFDEPALVPPLNDTNCLQQQQQQNTASLLPVLPADPAAPPVVSSQCPPSSQHPLLDSTDACNTQPDWLAAISEDEALPVPPPIDNNDDRFSFPVPNESFIQSPVGIPNNDQLFNTITDINNQDEANLGIPIRQLVEQSFPAENQQQQYHQQQQQQYQQQQQPMTMMVQQQQHLGLDQNYCSTAAGEANNTADLPYSRSDIISAAIPSNINCSSSSIIFASAGCYSDDMGLARALA